MRLTLIATVGLALYGSGAAQASVPQDGRLVLAAPVEGAAPARAHAPPRAARLGDFRLGGTAAGLVDDGGGAPDTKAIIAVVLAAVISFGVGHFFWGDVGTGIMFLVLELGLLVAGFIIIPILVGIFIASGASALAVLFPIIGLVLNLAALGIYIWQLYDIVMKTGILGGGGDVPAPPAIRSGVEDVAAASPPRMQPAFANALAFSF
jgi:hypothetical protein